MPAKILSGKQLAGALAADIRARAAKLAQKRGTPPHLAIVSIGGDLPSQIFLKRKLEACKHTGIEATVEALHDKISEAEAARILQDLSRDAGVDGIILEVPLPAHLNSRRLMEWIAPERDVEAMTFYNTGKLYSIKSYAELKSSDVLIPCTPNAIIHLLLETGADPAGKTAVVIGRSNILGRPAAHLLSCLNATVTLCHSKTENLQEHALRADILVAAAGKPRMIKGSWIKEGSVVLDAGVNSAQGQVQGDVDFNEASRRAGFITPVPGGVGPLTVTFLLHNTVLAAEQRLRGE